MPNPRPKAMKPATCLWAVRIVDPKALEKAIAPRDERYTVTVIEYNRAAPLPRLLRDFSNLITKQRYLIASRLDGLADELKVAEVAESLRAPAVRASMETRLSMGCSDDDVLAAYDEVPWPSATKILKVLGTPWTLSRVKKHLRTVKAERARTSKTRRKS